MPFAQIRGGAEEPVDFKAQAGSYETRLAEVVAEKFKAHGIDPTDGLSDEELGLAEDLTKEAQDQVKKEFGIE